MHTRSRWSVSLLTLLLATPTLAFAAEHHVAPDGTAEGTGEESDPWDLATALAHPDAVAPGDTIWMHGGTYTGHFEGLLRGTEEAPIVLRGAPSERATIDGFTGDLGTILTIDGAYTHYRDFEVTSTDPDHLTAVRGSRAGHAPEMDILTGSALEVVGRGVKLIHLVVHDAVGVGIGFWRTAVDAEIYGCLVYYNGWDGPDRGHGHVLYTQNETGTKHVVENIMFAGYGRGIEVYTESGSIVGFEFARNTIFNAGALSATTGRSWNIHIGGLQPADRIAVRENLTYHPFDNRTTNVRLEYTAINEALTVRDNYFVGGETVLKVSRWRSVELVGNTLFGTQQLVDFGAPADVDISTYTWDENTYYGDTGERMDDMTFDGWRAATGFDGASAYHTTTPPDRVVVHPSRYEPGRAHVTVFNHSRASSAMVDLSSFVDVGHTFEVRDAQNYYGAPVLTGRYEGGSVAVPMELTEIAEPFGNTPVEYEHTDSDFNVFVITSALGDPPSMTDGGIAAVDGGTIGDGGPRMDAGSRVDGGASPPDMSGGCACTVQGGSGRGGWFALVGVGLAVMRRRRARAVVRRST